MPENASADRQCGLILQQPGNPQQSLAKYLMLILNYRYGLDLMPAQTSVKAFADVQVYGDRIRCTAIVQNRKIASRTTLTALSRDDSIPLILVLPGPLIEEQRALCQRMENVLFCPWDTAMSRSETSILAQVRRSFESHDIGELFIEGEEPPFAEMQRRAEQRFANLKTLPTLPEIAIRIMTIVNDPDSSVEVLTEVVTSDSAIVHKVLQVVNSPIFAGSGHKGGWSLSDAIVRLGMNKGGAIAQQVKLMNSLVKPEESLFDLRRFWEHSVGCARSPTNFTAIR